MCVSAVYVAEQSALSPASVICPTFESTVKTLLKLTSFFAMWHADVLSVNPYDGLPICEIRLIKLYA